MPWELERPHPSQGKRREGGKSLPEYDDLKRLRTLGARRALGPPDDGELRPEGPAERQPKHGRVWPNKGQRIHRPLPRRPDALRLCCRGTVPSIRRPMLACRETTVRKSSPGRGFWPPATGPDEDNCSRHPVESGDARSVAEKPIIGCRSVTCTSASSAPSAKTVKRRSGIASGSVKERDSASQI